MMDQGNFNVASVTGSVIERRNTGRSVTSEVAATLPSLPNSARNGTAPAEINANFLHRALDKLVECYCFVQNCILQFYCRLSNYFTVVTINVTIA